MGPCLGRILHWERIVLTRQIQRTRNTVPLICDVQQNKGTMTKFVFSACIIILLLSSLSGCGTIITRTGYKKYGAYPYQAVGTDVVLLFLPPITIGAAISLPADAVVDTIFLPADLVHWADGDKKDGTFSDLH